MNEVVRQVGVQAFDAHSSATDASGGLHGVTAHRGDTATLAIRIVGDRDVVETELLFVAMNTTLALE
jgi:hypothetical protein